MRGGLTRGAGDELRRMLQHQRTFAADGNGPPPPGDTPAPLAATSCWKGQGGQSITVPPVQADEQTLIKGSGEFGPWTVTVARPRPAAGGAPNGVDTAPDVFVRVEWGAFGVVSTAQVDVSRGCAFTVWAESVVVSAVYPTPAAVGFPRPVLSAFICPGAGRGALPPQFTVRVDGLDVANNVIIRIPDHARRFSLYACNVDPNDVVNVQQCLSNSVAPLAERVGANEGVGGFGTPGAGLLLRNVDVCARACRLRIENDAANSMDWTEVLAVFDLDLGTG